MTTQQPAAITTRQAANLARTSLVTIHAWLRDNPELRAQPPEGCRSVLVNADAFANFIATRPTSWQWRWRHNQSAAVAAREARDAAEKKNRRKRRRPTAEAQSAPAEVGNAD